MVDERMSAAGRRARLLSPAEYLCQGIAGEGGGVRNDSVKSETYVCLTAPIRGSTLCGFGVYSPLRASPVRPSAQRQRRKRRRRATRSVNDEEEPYEQNRPRQGNP